MSAQYIEITVFAGSLLASLLLTQGCDHTRKEDTARQRAVQTKAVHETLDDWHRAAANADETAYFGALANDAVFLGTDASERWSKSEFLAYAHPHFDKGKAWTFKASRRAVMLDKAMKFAWFDEDLVTKNLGPARGSGILRHEPDAASDEPTRGRWRIVHYNLTITVPNERFKDVQMLLRGNETAKASPQ